jgi:hypothetical protein
MEFMNRFLTKDSSLSLPRKLNLAFMNSISGNVQKPDPLGSLVGVDNVGQVKVGVTLVHKVIQHVWNSTKTCNMYYAVRHLRALLCAHRRVLYPDPVGPRISFLCGTGSGFGVHSGSSSGSGSEIKWNNKSSDRYRI